MPTKARTQLVIAACFVHNNSHQQRRHLITGESAPGWYTVRTLTCFSLHNLGYKQHPSLALWAYFGQFEGVVGLLR